MKTSLELRRSRAALIEEMHDLCEKTSFGDEAQKRWRELDAQQKDLQKRIYRAEAEELDQEMRTVKVPPHGHEGRITGLEFLEQRPKQEGVESNSRLKPFIKDLCSSEYRDSFNAYCRFGMDGMTTAQRTHFTDLNAEIRTYVGLNTSTSGDAAGYTVPIGFQRELEVKLKAISQLRANSRLLNTSTGNVLDWPTMDDTGQIGEFLAEQNPVSQANPSFGQVQFSSFLASSKQVKVSVQVLQDSAFDLESELSTAFAIRIGRIVNQKYTNGTGTAEPQGLIYVIKNDSSPNTVKATGSASNDGGSGTEANSIGTDDLEKLIAAVDPLYRPGSMFMMNADTIDALRRLKDKYGRPVWNAGIAAATPDSIFGYPFFYNQDMDTVGPGKYPVAFGNFSKFVVRDVGGMTLVRYSELYMPTHEVGFQSFLRTDLRRLQQSAFSLLWNPLS